MLFYSLLLVLLNFMIGRYEYTLYIIICMCTFFNRISSYSKMYRTRKSWWLIAKEDNHFRWFIYNYNIVNHIFIELIQLIYETTLVLTIRVISILASLNYIDNELRNYKPNGHLRIKNCRQNISFTNKNSEYLKYQERQDW